jgi:hypothetical protein
MAEGRFGLPKLDVKPSAKWALPNSSTVPNDPANQINRAKGDPNKAAPGVEFHGDEKTINDGTTDVAVSVLNKPKVPGQFSPPDKEKQHFPPCINPTCKSFGKSHPNCLCYSGPGGSSLEQGHFAHGGCIGPHKEDCEHFADGGQVEEQTNLLNNPQDTLDHIGVQHGLHHLLTKTGNNGRSENKDKHFENYVDSARRGHKTLDSHVSKLLTKEKMDVEPPDTEALKAHLDDLNENPEKMLDIGGDLPSVLPTHGSTLAYRSANAVNYLNSIKPKGSQRGPLDRVIPPGKFQSADYDRALQIAENPSLVLHKAKHGTVSPKDLKTLNTIYPSLGPTLANKSFGALVDAKQKGTEIPFKTKSGLSKLLGQPLESSQTWQASQSIMQANMPTQPPQTQKQPKKVTNKGIDVIQKNEADLATPSQARLMGKGE